MKTIPSHPFAELLPEASEADVAALATDIQTRGLITPILVYEKKVLDGRTRQRACALVGVEPRFEEYRGDDPVGAVATLNLRGRNLNESQRALLAARLLEQWESAASANWHLNHGDRATMAAQLTNVSRRSAMRARSLLSTATPPTIDRVWRGELAVSRALASANPTARSAKRKPSHEKLALKLRAQIAALDAALRDACAGRSMRVELEDELSEFSRKIYSYADGSAFAHEGAA